MTKDESTIIKGIAILMMLFLHLFNGLIHDIHPDFLNEPYQPLFFIGDHPIEYILTRCCRPVPFFFILSGYGIGYMYTNGKLSINSQARRLFHIFIAYWISLLFFVSIGHFMGDENYPGDIWKLIGNVTSYSDSYNLSMWFLFPYTMICLSSVLFIKIIEHRKSYLVALIITGLIYGVTGYIIKNHIHEIGYASVSGHLLQYLQYLFPFTCGIILQRTSVWSNVTFLKYWAVRPAIRASNTSFSVITCSTPHAGCPVSRWLTIGEAMAASSPTRQPNL